MRILGVDVQSSGISAVEVETAFGRFEVRELHEVKFDPNVPIEQLNTAGAVQGLIQSLSKKPDRVVIAAPTEGSTFRNLQMATKDRKAIQSALDYELEDDLPFEAENIHYEYSILKSSGAGSLVHVGAVKKSVLIPLLEQYQAAGVDPDVITTEPWALRSVYSRIFGKEGSSETVLLVGLERNRTYFYVHDGVQPVLFREIPFGVKTIERNLEITLGAGPNESRKWVQDIGLSGAEEQISHLVSEGLQMLISEIKQTELQVQALLKRPIHQIQATGAGCLIPGFFPWLETMTDRNVGLFRPLSQVSSSTLTYADVSEVQYTKALGLALSLVPSDKANNINFRKGQFSKSNQNSHPMALFLKQIAPFAALVFGVFLFTKMVELKYYEQKLVDLDENLKRSVKNYYGGIADSAVRTYMADPLKLKRTIQSDLTKERELSKLLAQNPNSPLQFLKSISQKIGKDLVVDLVKFEVGTEPTAPYRENAPLAAQLTFQVSNPQQLEKLKELLQKNYGLQSGASEEITLKGVKSYRIPFTGTISGGLK